MSMLQLAIAAGSAPGGLLVDSAGPGVVFLVSGIISILTLRVQRGPVARRRRSRFGQTREPSDVFDPTLTDPLEQLRLWIRRVPLRTFHFDPPS